MPLTPNIPGGQPKLESTVTGLTDGKDQQFEVAKLIQLINEANDVKLLNFKFSNGSIPDVNATTPGYMFTDAALATEVTEIRLNKISAQDESISELLDFIEANFARIVLKFSKQDNSNVIFQYKITAVADFENYKTFTVTPLNAIPAIEFLNGSIYKFTADSATLQKLSELEDDVELSNRTLSGGYEGTTQDVVNEAQRIDSVKLEKGNYTGTAATLKEQIDGIVFESAKTYDTLQDAIDFYAAADPKPADGTGFKVSKLTDPANVGNYTFQSGEANGVRFESSFGLTESDTTNDINVDAVANTKAVRDGITSRNLLKDPYYEDYQDPGGTWYDLQNGNGVTVSNGVLTLDSLVASNAQIAQTVADIQEAIITDKYFFTLPIYVPSGYTGDLRVDIKVFDASTNSDINHFISEYKVGAWNFIPITGLWSDSGITDTMTQFRIAIYLYEEDFSLRPISLFSGKDATNTIYADPDTKINTRDYYNLIPDNTFQDDITYFQAVPAFGTQNVSLSRATDHPHQYGRYSLKALGINAASTNNYAGIYQDITSIAEEGDILQFYGLIYTEGASTYLQRRFRNASNTTIQEVGNISIAQNQWVEVSFEVTVPANGVYANFFVRNFNQNDSIYIAAWDLHLKNPKGKAKITSKRPLKTKEDLAYVSPTGDDDNDGTLASPFATFARAASATANSAFPKIILREGDYREKLDFGNFSVFTKKVTVTNYRLEKVRFMGSLSITGWTKTTGYTNVYEATLSNALTLHGSNLNKYVIFEDGNPSKPITESERHPLQAGLTHRLPYTELLNEDFDTDLGTTLTALDASGGGHYHDTGNNKIFLVTSDNDNPETNDYSYEYAYTSVVASPTIDKHLDLDLIGIESWYAKGNGMTLSNFNNITRKNCRVFGSTSDGFKDSVNRLVAYRDEAAGVGNDGQNGHVYDVSGWEDSDLRQGVNQAYYFNSWCHDNYDDGMSHHERGEVFTYGGLYEYNGDRGIAPSNSCIMECHQPFVRKNGQLVGVDGGTVGHGLSIVNAPDAGDGRYNSSLIAYGAQLIENTVGAAIQNTAGHKMILVDCVARENTSYNYSADEGEIIAYNCKSTQSSGNHKEEVNGGAVTVINDNTLT